MQERPLPYRFEDLESELRGDLAGGKVLYALPGQPALPVRLACEIFRRCLEHLPVEDNQRRLRLYDPCCGGAYHLAVLGLLYGERIGSILASDIDPEALGLAERNLGLLSQAGFDRRIGEIKALSDAYGKVSHAGALESALRLRTRLAQNQPILCRTFQADALDPSQVTAQVAGNSIDLVITDVPYGQHARWQETGSDHHPPAERLLESLLGVLPSRSLAAVVADKSQKIVHPAYERLEKFKVGKRQVAIMKPL